MSRSETVTLLKTIADYASTLALCAETLKDTAKEAETNAYGGYEAVDTTEVQLKGFSDIEECEGVLDELKGLLKDLDDAPEELPEIG